MDIIELENLQNNRNKIQIVSYLQPYQLKKENKKLYINHLADHKPVKRKKEIILNMLFIITDLTNLSLFLVSCLSLRHKQQQQHGGRLNLNHELNSDHYFQAIQYNTDLMVGFSPTLLISSFSPPYHSRLSSTNLAQVFVYSIYHTSPLDYLPITMASYTLYAASKNSVDLGM